MSSFNVVTMEWIGKIFILYTLMVLVLPYFVMRKFLRGRKMVEKFVFCVVGGNFFYIMLVLLWGVFHITNRYVLIVSTAILPVGILIKNRKKIWDEYFISTWIYFMRFVRRENSFHYILRKIIQWLTTKIKHFSKPLFLKVKNNFIECVLLLICSIAVFYYFSITNHFGPRASDLVVHMLWINEVDKGNLFCEGIYPFGMHALIYYMHAVFNIPTVRLVLLFGTVQAFYIFMMLLVFAKELCCFRYTPYLTYIAFVVGDYIQNGRYSRYYSTLPQEFGMIFLLPCAIAMLRFFQAVRDERNELKIMKKQKLLYTKIRADKRWNESKVQMWLLIISFGLTFSAHFYITIIAVFLLLPVVFVYIKYVFDWTTFRKLVTAGILAIVIPVTPMAVAFVGGTPLEGSLYWALEVMGIEISTEEADTEKTDITEIEETEEQATDFVEEKKQQTETEIVDEDEQPEPSLKERIEYLCRTAKQTTSNFIQNLILQEKIDFYVWIICMILLGAEIPLMWMLREWDRSRYNMFIILYNSLLLLIAISGYLGLPVIIDENRISIFFSYTVLLCLGLAADGVCVIGNHILKKKRVWQICSCLMVLAFGCYTVLGGRIREKIVNASSLQKDGAALCVYDIMENYPEKKWTIVSCNEERNMISPVAWHYEVIDFLESMEDYDENDEMYIPTQFVFFFIEKDVLNYALGSKFTDVDGTVSEEWATYDLPAKNGLSQYSSYERIIVNSRMYYWAKEYQKRFPNEMKVYYEDDEFVCYIIEQNEYYLNNFAIDYGFNTGGLQEWSADQIMSQ